MTLASLRPGGRRWRFGNWPVALQLTVGPVALLTVLVLTVGLALGVYFRTRTTSAAVIATYALLDDSSELTRLVIDQETSMRGFALARDEAFLEPYLLAGGEARRLLASLGARVAADPEQLGRLTRTQAVLDDWETNAAGPIIAAARAGGDPGAIVRSGAGQRRTDVIRAELRAFQAAAAGSLAQRQAADQRIRLVVVAAFLLNLGLAVLACLLALAAARGISAPARALAAAATRIAAGDLSVRVGAAVAASGGGEAPGPGPAPAGGGNELAATARAFDAMTDALTAARSEEAAAGRALREQILLAGRAESETRAVLDATAEAITLVDPDRKVRLLNRAFVEGFGLVPAEILGQDFRSLGPHVERIFDDPQTFLRLVAGTAADSSRRFSADVRQRWPRQRELSLFTSPVIAPDGTTLGRLYALRDVTAEREAARLREERRRQLEEELQRAAQLQADLLPREAPAVPGFELAARCLPAREVGGDFFDWHEPVSGEVTLTLGDVMGKGLPAALLMATVRAAIEGVARRSPPAEAVEAVAAATERDLERAGAFVTLFHARANAATRCVEYADAGHGHDFVRRASGAVEGLPVRGLPLGVLPEQTYRGGTVQLAPGDALVVYSDGLVDARPDLDLTPVSISRALDGAASAVAIVERLVSLAEGGPGNALPDDLTVVVLRCREAPEAG
jgi:PAS domain S-box-containing protein